MKKIMFAVVMMFATSAAFAADSDALKAILKAKNYADAAQLLNASVSQLATPAEKAKAYNHLVQLAMDKFNKEAAVDLANAALIQTGKASDVTPYDTVGYYEAAYNALVNAIECDKYDHMPDAKGKVKPKFREKNLEPVANARVQLVNAGQREAQLGNEQGVLKYWGTFLDTDQSPLFSAIDHAEENGYFYQVALFTSQYAYQEQRYDLANKYVDMAMNDSSTAKEAMNLKVIFMQQGLKTKEDSLACIQKLNELETKYPDNDVVFNSLVQMYSNLKMNAELGKLIDDKLAVSPKFFPALRAKGYEAMNAQKWDDAVAGFKAALDVNPDDVLALTYIGFSINAKAAEAKTEAQVKAIYQQSLPYLEKARSLDPDRTQANWSYPLYQCYYGIYGAEDSRTKELESMVK